MRWLLLLFCISIALSGCSAKNEDVKFYQDESYLSPDDPRSTNAVEEGNTRRAVEDEVKQQRAKDFAEIERLLHEAWQAQDANMAIMAYNMAAGIKEHRLTPAKDSERATRLKERANQMINDIDRWMINRRGG